MDGRNVLILVALPGAAIQRVVPRLHGHHARSDDVVWRVRAGGEWVYLYLLFEFQRSVDKHMALRMMVYIGLLYQDLVKSGQGLPKGRLPPVLPIVLYNGHRRWTARTNIADLIPPLPNPMNGYVRRRNTF